MIATGVAIYFFKSNLKLKQQNQDQQVNIKSLEQGVIKYKDKFGGVYARIIEQRKTIDDITFANDTAMIALKKQLVAANIKLKDVEKIQIQSTKLVRDTSIVYLGVDTTYNLSNPPHIYETITVKNGSLRRQLEINDKVTTITHVTKVDKRLQPLKKFFLWRLFQKKRLLTNTDINHTNPYVDIESATQIQVLDNRGNPISH